MFDIRINKDAKDTLLNAIIDMEWVMFDKVQNEGCRASCQDDFRTFYIMRYSQFRCFSEATLKSYAEDLVEAGKAGRNLLTEKYAYMMEFTDEVYFLEKLKPYLPHISEEKKNLVKSIASMLLEYEKNFRQSYPNFADRVRPVTGIEGHDVSFNVYTIGELETYSLRTLASYVADLKQFNTEGLNPSILIHEKIAEFYGYSDLRKAEEGIR